MPTTADIRAPFDRAIEAFASRTAVITKERFLRLEEADRARAFTVARVQDLDVLADLRQSMRDQIGKGGSFRDFIDDINGTMERRGWTGLTPWHQRLVYDQNVGMAYTAGRYDQAKENGVTHWRKLPTTSRVPRPEHEKLNGEVFPMDGPQAPPPWDFGCNCEWEVVFEEEVPEKVQTGTPGTEPDQEFKFHPRSYFGRPSIRLSDYPPELHDVVRKILAEFKAGASAP